MSLTFIDTNTLPRTPSTGQGDVTEVLNRALCGANNVHGSLRWVNPADVFTAESSDKHQLVYLMDGKGRVRLNGRDYDVEKGCGVYLGPSESASIEARGGAPVKLFHLVVPRIPK